jgi:hypothetical protein
MELSLNPYEGDLENASDDSVDYDVQYVMFASHVVGFDGMIRTNPYQKNLKIRWVYYSGNPKLAGTLQNVHVVLERYNGDPSVVPETTKEEPERYTR